jgi:glucose-6-phosphate 1-epimerase
VADSPDVAMSHAVEMHPNGLYSLNMAGYPEGVRVDRGQGGLERLVLEAREGEAYVYLHGANVAHFQPKLDKPVLMMSRKSVFEAGSPGQPIRGGVPICFPWFGVKAGDAAAPPHGVARLLPWRIESVAAEAGGRLRATLTLESDGYTRGVFPHDFALRFVVSVGASLGMELTVRNTGQGPLTFEEALHSYLAVSDVRQIALTGLEGATYIDKTDAFKRKVAPPGALEVRGETDRVFLGTQAAVTLRDPAWQRRIVVTKKGSNTTIVWNPWSQKAKVIPDLGDDDWQGMVCVETANAADDAIVLAPGATHVVSATIEAHPEQGR